MVIEMNQTLTTMTLAAAAAALTGCAQQESTPPQAGMANPASVYCVKIGGTLRIEKGPNGESGICVLPDGSEIEEWALFRRDAPK